MKFFQNKSSLKLNIIFNSIYQIFMLLVPLLTAPYVSRVLLEGQIGSYSYSTSIVYYFTTVAAFGFLDYGTIVIAKNRNDKEARAKLYYGIFYCKILLTMAVLAVYYILVGCDVFFSPNYPENTMLIYAVLGLNIFSTMFDMTFFFQGMENFLTICLRNFLVKVVNIICIFVFVRGSSDFLAYVIIMVLSTVFSALITFLSAPRYVGRPIFRELHLLTHFKRSFFYFLPLICMSITTYFPKTCLGLMNGDPVSSAYFEQADRVINIVVSAISSVNSVLLCRMSYLYATKNEKEITKKNYQTLELYLLLAIPALMGIVAVNPFFTPGFFGDAYQGSVSLVYLLAPRILFAPLYAILGAIYFIPQGKTRTRNLLYLFSCCSNILLSLLLIYLMGAKGAALAYMLSELLTAFLFAFLARKGISYSRLATNFIKIFDAAFLMFLLCIGCETFLQGRLSSIGIALVSVAIGTVAYGSFLLLFRESMTFSVAGNLLGKIKNLARRKK